MSRLVGFWCGGYRLPASPLLGTRGVPAVHGQPGADEVREPARDPEPSSGFGVVQAGSEPSPRARMPAGSLSTAWLALAVVLFGLGFLVLAPLGYFVSYRLCRRLQRADRDVLYSGVASGIIERRPEGYYVELVQPLRPEQEPLRFPRYQGNPVPHLPGDLETEKDEPAGHPQ